MNFDPIITDTTGLVHTLASILALIFGTWVLLTKKGNQRHKQMGYAYTASMAAVLVTSFFMYNLFGGFGIFHVFAIVSSATLVAGMVPILRKKPKHYISLHFNFMYWSVIGLYGAFLAEVLTRIPPMVIQDKEILPLFFKLVGLSIFIIMGFGYYFMFKKKKDWAKFEKSGS
jgi:uncharacterized membrane protein